MILYFTRTVVQETSLDTASIPSTVAATIHARFGVNIDGWDEFTSDQLTAAINALPDNVIDFLADHSASDVTDEKITVVLDEIEEDEIEEDEDDEDEDDEDADDDEAFVNAGLVTA